MHLIDAIVLAKLLSTLPARRVHLHIDRYRSEEGDQRGGVDLRELAGRVRTPPDGLVREVTQARREVERLLKLGSERGDKALASDGAVVSECPPGAPPLVFHFPRRTRIISGLARAVVIVEASGRSGSTITARCAADQGRGVMAVPGNVLTDRSRGGHALIKDGAKVVQTADDILE